MTTSLPTVILNSLSYVLKVNKNHCFSACDGRLFLALRKEAAYQAFLKGTKIMLINVGYYVSTGLEFITQSKV